MSDIRKTMPISSPRNDFYSDQIRYSERGVAQTTLEFDPTGGMEEDDSDDEGDPFAKMMRDRE